MSGDPTVQSRAPPNRRRTSPGIGMESRRVAASKRRTQSLCQGCAPRDANPVGRMKSYCHAFALSFALLAACGEALPKATTTTTAEALPISAGSVLEVRPRLRGSVHAPASAPYHSPTLGIGGESIAFRHAKGLVVTQDLRAEAFVARNTLQVFAIGPSNDSIAFGCLAAAPRSARAPLRFGSIRGPALRVGRRAWGS